MRLIAVNPCEIKNPVAGDIYIGISNSLQGLIRRSCRYLHSIVSHFDNSTIAFRCKINNEVWINGFKHQCPLFKGNSIRVDPVGCHVDMLNRNDLGNCPFVEIIKEDAEPIAKRCLLTEEVWLSDGTTHNHHDCPLPEEKKEKEKITGSSRYDLAKKHRQIKRNQ